MFLLGSDERCLHRDEVPVGEWKIRVSDQRNDNYVGSFLGWTMTIWGSVIDAGKDMKSLVVSPDDDENVFPPLPPNITTTTTSSSTVLLPTSTRTLGRPTDHLPEDHGHATGENSKPAFTMTAGVGTSTEPAKPAENAATSATNVPTPDEGWFSDLSNLVTNQIWFFVAIGAVSLFGIGAGLFFWRRAVQRKRRANYSSLRNDDDVAMGALGRVSGGSRGPPQRTKELYDAFGEVSDDEDVDEETALRPHSISPGLDTGLHSGFLDDDDPPTAGSGKQQSRYRDEPDSPAHDDKERERERSDSPGSGSGSGSSWEHASETR